MKNGLQDRTALGTLYASTFIFAKLSVFMPATEFEEFALSYVQGEI